MAVTVPYVFTFDQIPISSSQVNANFAALVNGINAIPTPTSLQGFRNRFINGAMAIDQRNGGAAQNALVSSYTLDRMNYFGSANGKFNSQQNAGSVTPPVGASYYLGLTSTASTSVGSADIYVIGQRVEGLNIQDLGFGTAFAQPISLSFWVYSSLTGTFAGSLRNGAGDRSYVFTYSIASANTWTKITIQNIPGDVSGTWLTTNGTGIQLFFSLGCGSTVQTTPGVWTSGDFFCTNTSVNVVSTNGATFYITSLQLEPGAVCTTFENRLQGVELLLCQRYYISSEGAAITMRGYELSSGTNYGYWYAPVTMRATPAIIGGAYSGTNNATGQTPQMNGTRQLQASIIATLTGDFFGIFSFTGIDAEL